MAISAPWGLCVLPGLQCIVGTRFPLCPNTKFSRRKGLLLWRWWLGLGIPHQERGGPGGLDGEKGASGISASVFIGCFPFSIPTEVKQKAHPLGRQGSGCAACIYLSPAERYQQRAPPGSFSPSVRGEWGKITAKALCDCRASGVETSRNQASGSSQVSAHTLSPLSHLSTTRTAASGLGLWGRWKEHLVLGPTFMKDPKSRL